VGVLVNYPMGFRQKVVGVLGFLRVLGCMCCRCCCRSMPTGQALPKQCRFWATMALSTT
jgi:hypothetical protein